MGAYDYFTKPLSPDDLKTVLPLKIRNAVTARRLMAETSRQNEIMRRELEIAARYQRFLLPHEVSLPGIEVAYLFQPCTGVGAITSTSWRSTNGAWVSWWPMSPAMAWPRP